MLFHEFRRATRTSSEGDITLLEHQERSRWDKALIADVKALLQRAFATGEIGTYAKISAPTPRRSQLTPELQGSIAAYFKKYLLRCRFACCPII